MKGNQKVISQLNFLLIGELTAMDLYFLHSKMYKNWGHEKLHERIGHEIIDETEHARRLIERIIFLGGMPDLSKRDPSQIKDNVQDMLSLSLEYEYVVAKNLRAAIAICEEEKDYVSRSVLRELLADTEEDHIYWLEIQLGLMKKVGMENYLQSMS